MNIETDNGIESTMKNTPKTTKYYYILYYVSKIIWKIAIENFIDAPKMFIIRLTVEIKPSSYSAFRVDEAFTVIFSNMWIVNANCWLMLE